MDEPEDAAVERNPADPRFGEAEPGTLGGHDDVAAEHHLHAAAERVAVDPGDDRDVEAGAQAQAAEAIGVEVGPVLQAGLVDRVGGHVGADAERPVAVAGDHDDADLSVGLDLGPDLVQPGQCLGVDGVEHLGAADGDPGDVPVPLVAHLVGVRVAHRRMPFSRSTAICCMS